MINKGLDYFLPSDGQPMYFWIFIACIILFLLLPRSGLILLFGILCFGRWKYLTEKEKLEIKNRPISDNSNDDYIDKTHG